MDLLVWPISLSIIDPFPLKNRLINHLSFCPLFYVARYFLLHLLIHYSDMPPSDDDDAEPEGRA